MKKTRKITPVTRFAYGTGNLLGSGALAISGSWLLFFYTTFCHLPIAQATLIFLSTYMQANAFHVIRRISFKHTRRTIFLPSHIHMIKDAPAILPGHSHT